MENPVEISLPMAEGPEDLTDAEKEYERSELQNRLREVNERAAAVEVHLNPAVVKALAAPMRMQALVNALVHRGVLTKLDLDLEFDRVYVGTLESQIDEACRQRALSRLTLPPSVRPRQKRVH